MLKCVKCVNNLFFFCPIVEVLTDEEKEKLVKIKKKMKRKVQSATIFSVFIYSVLILSMSAC